MAILPFARRRLALALVALSFTFLVVAAACNGDDNDIIDDEMPPIGETPAVGETPDVGETPEMPPPGETPEPATAEIAMVPSILFDRNELTIPADTDVTVTADNRDQAVSHNFAVYTDESAAEDLGKTEICSGPCVDEVTLNLPAGEYFFRCDVHPNQMTGTLIVQ